MRQLGKAGSLAHQPRHHEEIPSSCKGRGKRIITDDGATSTLHRYGTRAVSVGANGDGHGIPRQQFLHQLRPLHEAERAAVEVVLEAHVVDLLQALDTIEVEMEDGRAIPGGILIDQGESGRGDDILHPQLPADGLDERGLARAHLAIEGEHLGIAHLADEQPGGLLDLVY